MSLNNFTIVVHCLVDDVLKKVINEEHLITPKLSDAEIITMKIIEKSGDNIAYGFSVLVYKFKQAKSNCIFKESADHETFYEMLRD